MISLFRMRTSCTISSRMSSTRYRLSSSSEMSSPSMSSLKSWPCRLPPLEKSTSKSNFTLLCVACSLLIDRLHPHNIVRYSPEYVEGEFSEVQMQDPEYPSLSGGAMPAPNVERRASRDGGGTLSDRLGDVQNIFHLRHGVRTFQHIVPQRTYTPLT